MKKYVEYTNRRVNQMKQGLRAGTPRLELAKTLCKEWGVPRNAVYQKIHKVAAELKAFKNKKKLEKSNVVNQPLEKYKLHKDLSKISIVKKTNNTLNGIELSGDALKVYNKLKREPNKIVLFDNHVRYYFAD
tara:strand:+ start:253 stop:648 length:396 start_codon:yes stop_codon:yes gene_type:complete